MTSSESASSNTLPDDRYAVRERQAQRSALWAAYGDALGWISELTDAKGLRRRTGGAALEIPVAWKRRVGGRSGVTVELPVGCYSDDTQLRLATSRAIRCDGFDVEAFAKVELPIWRGYALGAGKGTSAAATNMTKSSVAWFANRFKGWTDSGGNGAAMRVQPHVWAARSPENAATFLPDVVRNSVCTHSHPVGLLGAVLHSLMLAFTVVRERAPSPDDVLAMIKEAARLPQIIAGDVEVASYWRTAFEHDSGDFERAWAKAVAQSREAVEIVAESAQEGGMDYSQVITRLGLTELERRGSGILTAVAAASLTWLDATPEETLRIAANAVGTDTDTIATMAGAILGTIAEHEPPVEVLDAELFRSEASRLTAVAFDKEVPSHRYPDLVDWVAPKGRADALIRATDGTLRLVGLGPADSIGDTIPSGASGFAWRWVRVAFGQTLLVKHRVPLRKGPESVRRPAGVGEETRPDRADANLGRSPDMLTMFGSDRSALDRDISAPKMHPRHMETLPSSFQQTEGDSVRSEAGEFSQARTDESKFELLLRYLEEHIDDDLCVGRALRRVVEKGTPSQAMEFLAAYYRLVKR